MSNHETKYRFEQKAEADSYKLYIYDAVRAQGKFNWDTWSYEQSETSAKFFRDKLDEIPDGSTIEVHVNSRGGEVGEGVTIYNLLCQKKNAGCTLIGYVDGMAYSVAMDIVMACSEIRMGYGTSMFLHNPWAEASGNAEQHRSVASQLDALTDASVQLYMSRAKNLTEESLREMMNKETMLPPDACLEYGFCDYVGEKKKEEEELEGKPEGESGEGEEKDDNKKDLQMKQLKEQLFQERQIKEMLRGLNQVSMKSTFTAALQQLSNK